MELVKAAIEILSGEQRRIEIQFNPNALLFRKEAVVNEIGLPGLGSPLLQFVRGEAETLDLELFCDTTRDGLAEDARDVRAHTQPIRDLLEIEPGLGAIPVVRFCWGDGLRFTGVVVSLEQSFTLFSPAGVPLRARLFLRLKEHRTLAEQVARRARGGADHGDGANHGDGADRKDDADYKDRDQASGSTVSLPALPLRYVEIRGDGKALASGHDLLGLKLSDDIGGVVEVEITLNDWDPDRARCRYADLTRFDPGASFEIHFRAPLVESACRVAAGVVSRLSRVSPADGPPRLVVSGSGRSDASAGGRLLRLAHGESLIEMRSETRSAAEAAGPECPSSAAGVMTRINGTCSGMPALRAGTEIEIEDFSKRFAGRYLVIGTTHTIDESGYSTRFEGRPARHD